MHSSTKFAVRGWRASRGPVSLLLSAVAATAGAAQPAATQTDPPAPRAAPRYVEECIAEARCAPGDEADTCTTDFGKPDACKQKHAKDGFVFTCKTRNMSRWSEVWCRPSKAAASGAAAAEKNAQ